MSAVAANAEARPWAQAAGAPPDGATSAQPPPADDLDALEAQIDQTLEGFDSLLRRDCAAACEALESMARAAERICELEPGPRCDEAQRRVREAAERLRNACPDCEAAQATPDAQPSVDKRPGREQRPAPRQEERDAPTQGKEELQAGEAEAAPAAPAPVEASGGGCAACSLGAPARSWDAPLSTLLLGLALVSRRCRRAAGKQP